MMLRRVAPFLIVCSTLAANPEPSPAPAEQASPAPAKVAAPAPAAGETKSPDSSKEVSHAPENAAVATPAPSTGTEPDPFAKAPPEIAAVNEAAKDQASAEGITLQHHLDVDHVQVGHQANPEEIASLLRLGHTKRDHGDFASAEIAFMQVLAERATKEQDREAVLGLARTFRKKGDFTKSAASYERFVKEFPNDPELPTIYLELGRTLRALGAYKQAIARFYSVLNSTLKLPDQGPDQYRQLVRTAQYEIAETYFQIGDYVQANRFFSRLKLLDLAPEDRARAHFKSVVALSLAGDDEKAVPGLRAFLDQNPDDENVPEAQYILSVSLRRLGRTQESLRATLDLLKAESSRTSKDPRRWEQWQRKTGNQLANEFYEHGDFESALLIYTNLAQISAEPSWNLPVTYQLGLCYERLRRFDRARECYKAIVDTAKTAKSDASTRADLSDLAEMAEWRLSQLAWQYTNETQLSAVFAPAAVHLPVSTPNITTPPASASASDHDNHGSAPIASHTLR